MLAGHYLYWEEARKGISRGNLTKKEVLLPINIKLQPQKSEKSEKPDSSAKMLSYALIHAKNRIVSFLKEVCPCLDPVGKKTHNIEDIHRKARFMNNWELGKEIKQNKEGKLFTVESMKSFTQKNSTEKGIEMVNTTGSCFMESCSWNTESNDMLLKVGRSVFPVHKFLLSIESEILRTIIDSVPVASNRITVVTLNGYEADDIKMLLTFVYLPESEIEDTNVLTLLKLANELMIEELVVRCEDYLLSSNNQPPLTLLRIANKYQLPTLEESAAIQASKIPHIDQRPEFKTLTKKQQQKVLIMSKNRYRSGSLSYSSETYFVQPPCNELQSPELKLQRRLQDVAQGETGRFKGKLAFITDT